MYVCSWLEKHSVYFFQCNYFRKSRISLFMFIFRAEFIHLNMPLYGQEKSRNLHFLKRHAHFGHNKTHQDISWWFEISRNKKFRHRNHHKCCWDKRQSSSRYSLQRNLTLKYFEGYILWYSISPNAWNWLKSGKPPLPSNSTHYLVRLNAYDGNDLFWDTHAETLQWTFFV